MSNDWTGRPGQARRPRRPAPPPTPLALAQEARAGLQEQFYRVDQFQSDIGGTVKLYAELLPERSARTGVVPGWASLDEQATELIVAYLELLDRFDPLEECTPAQVLDATYGYGQLTPKLGLLGNDMEGFLDRFGPELRRVGEVRQRVENRLAEAAAKVAEAENAWRSMTDAGFQFDAADQAVVRARVAGRKLAAAGGQLTPDKVDEGAAVVEKLAAAALALATDLPRRAATLRHRIPSLATRIDALQTRAESVPESMRALRREFSAANWDDLAHRETEVTALLARGRDQVHELRRLHEAGNLTAALSALDEVETSLDDATALVDGPRERLRLLRTLRDDPQHHYDATRFRLRDARYLLLDGKSAVAQPWAGRLDTAATELIALESFLEGHHHPDYWALHLRLEALNARLRTLVDDFRAAH
ncbi:hypothetical protein NOCA2370010 [metagenome]|uniref:Uncharacterized protein n=1 Tax=metagenome TaxID=256318 RepID=A0A2P2C4B8_9ZZZZ